MTDQRPIRALSIACLIAAASVASAGTPPPAPVHDPVVDKHIDAARGQVYALREDTLNKVLKLDAAQLAAYNPITKAYDDELMALGDQRIALIKEYAAYFKARSLDDAAADRLTKQWFKLQNDQLALWRKYHGKLSKAVGPVKAAEWLQVERAFATAIDLRMVAEMPLIGDAVKQ